MDVREMNSAPQSFLESSHLIGTRTPDWIQGAGGNVSEKQEGVLWIKASGSRLDQMTSTMGVAAIQMATARDSFAEVHNETDYGSWIKQVSDPRWGRASMEAGFHVFLPGRFVFHFHALAA